MKVLNFWNKKGIICGIPASLMSSRLSAHKLANDNFNLSTLAGCYKRLQWKMYWNIELLIVNAFSALIKFQVHPSKGPQKV